MKGYRTIAFNLAMFVLGLAGLHVAPETAARGLDAFLSALVVGNIFLRAVTDTPMFNGIAKEVGLSPQQADAISRAVTAALPHSNDTGAAVSDLAAKVDALAQHPIFDPALVARLATAIAPQPASGVKP
jgi:hypothetical protein